MPKNVTQYFTRFLIVAAMAVMTAYASAETVSQKHAKQLAQDFFNQAYGEVTAPVKLVYTGKRLTTDRLFTPFYVYNQSRGGFVIISAESKAYPILGFSLKSGFDPDRLSEGEKGWLKGYAEDIELLRYDPREPAQVLRAWQRYPEYVASLLEAEYDATDPAISESEAVALLSPLLEEERTDTDAYYSAFYTPDSWQETITFNLDKSADGSIPVGYVDFRKKLHPGIIHGRQGDYFRIRFDRPNDWLMRLNPSEYLGERQIAWIASPGYTPEPEEEEPPFIYLDGILAETRSPEEKGVEEMPFSVEEEPIVRHAGSGHFDVLLPENASLAQIFNLAGNYVRRHTYAGQPVAHIDIEAEPTGFYFAIIYGESGRPYGVKLYR